MGRIHAALAQFKHDEKGAAVFEYGLTAALVGIVLLLVAGLLGGSLGATFGSVASSFSTGTLIGTGPSSSGQAVPAAGTSSGSFCGTPLQSSLLVSPGTSCRPSSSPAVTVGSPAVAG